MHELRESGRNLAKTPRIMARSDAGAGTRAGTVESLSFASPVRARETPSDLIPWQT